MIMYSISRLFKIEELRIWLEEKPSPIELIAEELPDNKVWYRKIRKPNGENEYIMGELGLL